MAAEPTNLSPDELLERSQWDFFWAPPETLRVDRPELAYLASEQDATLLNTVTRTRAVAERLPALIEEVGAAHARVTSQWLVPPTFDTAPLERLLVDGGWSPTVHLLGFTVPTHRFEGRGGAFTVRAVTDLPELREALALQDMVFRGGGRRFSEAELQREVEACTRPGARVRRFVAYDAAGTAVSSGAYSLFPELGFGYLFGGATRPEARGRGAYSAVLAARVADAHARGLTRVGLYARTDTSASIVAKQGFERHGPLTFWQRPRPGA